MSQVVEIIKYGWDHKSQIFDGVVYAGSALAGWRAVRFLGTADIAPNHVCVRHNRFTGATIPVVNRIGEPRSGMMLKLPWERRIFIPVGDETIDTLEVGSDGEQQQIQLLYPDGKPSAGWVFDAEISYSIHPQFADLLVQQLGTRVNPRTTLTQEMIRIAKVAGPEALKGQSTASIEEPGGLERFAYFATAQFEKRLAQREWGQAVKFNYMAFSSPKPPEAYSARLEEEQRLALVDKANQVEALRIRRLGRDGIQQSILANAGRVFVFQGGGRSHHSQRGNFGEPFNIIEDAEAPVQLRSIVDALRNQDEETAILDLQEAIESYVQESPIRSAITGDDIFPV